MRIRVLLAWLVLGEPTEGSRFIFKKGGKSAGEAAAKEQR